MTHNPEDNSDRHGAHLPPLSFGSSESASDYASMENIADLRRRSARIQRLLAYYANQVFGLYGLHRRVTKVLDARGEPTIKARVDTEISTREYVDIMYTPISYEPKDLDSGEQGLIEIGEKKVYERGVLKAVVPELVVYESEDELDGEPSVVFSCYDLVVFSGGSEAVEMIEPSVPEILYATNFDRQDAELRKRDAQLAAHILWLGRGASELGVPQRMEPFAVDPFLALDDVGMN